MVNIPILYECFRSQMPEWLDIENIKYPQVDGDASKWDIKPSGKRSRRKLLAKLDYWVMLYTAELYGLSSTNYYGRANLTKSSDLPNKSKLYDMIKDHHSAMKEVLRFSRNISKA